MRWQGSGWTRYIRKVPEVWFTFLIEKMPDPSAIWTRGEDKHTEWGGSALTKEQMTPHYFNDLVLGRCLEMAATNGWVVKTNPYEGGSDHIPFIRARKPGLLFWHFTDQFYHTDGDRLEMVSADELRNVGVSALVSGLLLTGGDGAAARHHLVRSAFGRQRCRAGAPRRTDRTPCRQRAAGWIHARVVRRPKAARP